MATFLLLILVIWIVVVPILHWFWQLHEDGEQWKREEAEVQKEMQTQKDWEAYQAGEIPMTEDVDMMLLRNMFDLPIEERASSVWAKALRQEQQRKKMGIKL